MEKLNPLEGFSLTLLQTLKDFRYTREIILPNKGTHIFEFIRKIDENKRHILYLERHIDEVLLSDEETLLNGKNIFDESHARKFDDYVKFELAYQVKKEASDLVFWEEGNLEEGVEDLVEAKMYKLIGCTDYADYLTKPSIKH